MTKTQENPKKKNNKIQAFADYAPLLIFFIIYKFSNIFVATASLIVTSSLALGLVYFIEKRVALMPLITAILVLFFGGATLILQDENLIKLKSTLIQILFASIFLGSLLLKKPVLQFIFKDHLKLQPRGWHIMTRNYAILFFVSAALNEFIRLTQTTDFWVNFKVFGLTGIFIIFGITQIFTIQAYLIEDHNAEN